MFRSIPLWLRIGFLFVVVGSALLIWQVPQWRASKVLERVEVAIAQRDFETAETELKALLARNPRQIPATLRLAEILRLSEANEAFSLLYGLHTISELPQDRYPATIIMGFEVGRTEEARELLESVQAKTPDLPRLMGALAVASLVDGDLATARSQLEESLALFPEWNELRFIAGQLLRRSPSRIDQLRAKEDLRTVAESSEFEGIRAIFALVESEDMTLFPEEKHAYLGKILVHPWASPRFRLLAHHYRWQLLPEEKESEIEAAIADLGDDHPVMLAEWMNAIGEPERALALVPGNELATSNPQAFEQRFRALAMGGRFAEAEELVHASDVGESALQQAARLFLVALRPDNSEQAVERWNEAFALAISENDIGVQYFLGRSALRLGYLAGAIQAYGRLFAEEEFSSSAAESVWMEYFTLTLATGTIEDAHAVISEAFGFFPESLALINNRLYIELISEMEWEATYAQFMRLAPPLAEIRDINGTGSTWVLSTLFREEPEEALRILELIEKGNPNQAINDSTKIVKALVFAANQNLTAAVRLSEEIDREKVLPAEWALLSKLRLEP